VLPGKGERRGGKGRKKARREKEGREEK